MISVLYVDDEHVLIDLAKDWLNKEGYAVTGVDSAKEALEILDVLKFDVIISDYEMPEMNGIEFLAKIREKGLENPFIIFTGRGREEVVIAAINSGADFYLQKGGDAKSQFAELTHMIRQACSRNKAQKGLIDSMERYRSVFDAMPSHFILFEENNTNGNIKNFYCIDCNRQFSELLQIPRSELVGKSVSEILFQSLKFLIRHIQDHYDTKKSIHTEDYDNKFNKWFEISVYSPKQDQIAVLMNDCTKRKEIQKQLTHKLNVEQLITELSTQFIHLRPEEIDDAINHTLKICGEYANVDRSYVFLIDTQTSTVSNTHEWCNTYISSQKDNLVNIPCSDCSWWMDKMLEFKPLIIPSVANLPDDAASERSLLLEQNIISLMAIPLVFENSLIGFIGFDNVVADHQFQDEDINTLVLIGNVITNALVRRQIEYELISREKMYRALTETTPDWVWEINRDGEFVYSNPKVFDILGYSSDEVLNKTFVDFVPEREKKRVKSLFEEIRQNRDDICGLETINLTKEGQEKILETCAVAILTREGQITGYRGIVRDITHRIELEISRLSKRDEILTSVLDLVPDYILLIEGDTIIYVNTSFQNVLKRVNLNVIGTSVFEYLKDQNQRSIKKAIDQHIHRQPIEPFSLKTDDGFLFITRGVPITWRGKDVSIIILTDITEIHNLRENVAIYGSIFNQIYDGVAISDLEGNLIYTNKTWDSVFNSSVIDINSHMSIKNILSSKILEPEFNVHCARVWEHGYDSIHVRKQKSEEQDWILHTTLIKNTNEDVTGYLHRINSCDLLLAGGAMCNSLEKFGTNIALIQSMCDNVPDMIWAKDKSKRYIFANKAICEQLLHTSDRSEVFGYDDLHFETLATKDHPDDLEWHNFGTICSVSDDLVMTSKSPMRFDETGTSMGRTLHLDVYKAPLYDYHGELIGTVGTAHEVTREREMLRALRYSEELFHILFDRLPSGVIIVAVHKGSDAFGKKLPVFPKIIDMNRAAEEILMCSREVLIGNSIADIFPYEKDRWLTLFLSPLATGTEVHAEISLKNEEFIIDITVFPIPGDRLIFILTDITPMKRSLQAMTDSEEKFRHLVEELPEYIVVYRGDTILYVNPAGASILGCNPDNLIGTSIFNWVSPESLSHFKSIVERRKTGEHLPPYEIEIVGINGEKTPVIAQAVNTTYRHQPAVIGVLSDISEIKKAQLVLQQNEERLKALVSFFTMENESDEKIMKFALDKAVHLTNSKVGFIAFINEELDLFTVKMWSQSILEEFGMDVKDKTFKVSEVGLFSEPIRTRKPVIINDYLHYPSQKQGFPIHHISFNRMLIVPVLYDHRVVMLIAVANKTETYDSGDQNQLILLAEGVWVSYNLRQSSLALRDSEYRYRTLISHIPDYVLVHDGNEILYINESLRSLINVNGYDYKQVPLFTFIASPYQKKVYEAIQKRMQGEEIPPYEIEIITPGGINRWVEVRASRITFDNRLAILTVLTDISLRKKHEKEKTIYNKLLKASNDATHLLIKPESDFSSFTKALEILCNSGIFSSIFLYGIHNTKENRIGALIAGYSFNENNTISQNLNIDAEAIEFLTQNPSGIILKPDESLPYYAKYLGDQQPNITIIVPIISNSDLWGLLIFHLSDPELIPTESMIQILETIGGGIKGSYERMVAEEQLISALQKYQTLAETIPDWVWEIDPTGTFTYSNMGVFNHLGYSPDQIIGKAYISFIADSSPSTTKNSFLTALQEKHSIENLEKKTFHIDGSELTFESNASPIFGEDGSLIGYCGVDRNITIRKTLEESLKKQEQNLRMVMDAVKIGIVLIDPSTHAINDANKEALNMIGLKKSEILGKICHNYICPAEMGCCPITDLGMEVDRSERTLLTASGENVPILKSVIPITLDKSYLLESFADITPLYKMKTALSRSNEKLNLLAGITRHDIANQLTIQYALIDLMEDGIENAELKNYLSDLRQTTEIIQSQILFTQAYQQVGTILVDWYDLERIISSVTKQFSSHGLNFSQQLNGYEICADPLFEKVIYTLIDNSIRHGQKVQNIGFITEVKDNNLYLIYQDDGIGIIDDMKDNIFERGVGKNTGLGLFLSREILNISGFTISETGIYGQGVRFIITIPQVMFRKNRS